MKNLIFALCLSILAVSSTGCQSHTEYGECVGIQDEDQQNSKLVYKVSVRNTVLGIIFVETLFAPAIWLLADFRCPVAQK